MLRGNALERPQREEIVRPRRSPKKAAFSLALAEGRRRRPTGTGPPPAFLRMTIGSRSIAITPNARTMSAASTQVLRPVTTRWFVWWDRYNACVGYDYY
jgi:hypothetical protein